MNPEITRRIEQHMTPYPCIASSELGVREAFDFMIRSRIRHLPVVEEGELVGVVSERDLRQALLVPESAGITVGDVMTEDPYCVPLGTPLSAVADEMARSKYGCTVVRDAVGRVTGIFTTTDGMRVLSDLLANGRAPDLRMIPIEELLIRDQLMGAS